MLATYAELEVTLHFATTLSSKEHQFTHAVLVDGFKWVALQETSFKVRRHHAAFNVVAAKAKHQLREVVGAKAEEVGFFSKFIGTQCCTRCFNHCSDGDLRTRHLFALVHWRRTCGVFAQHFFYP